LKNETCRKHAYLELGDWLYLTAEIIYMITRIELSISTKKSVE